MKALKITAVAALLAAAAAFALPADLVVMSAREVRPDEAVGLYYLGQAGGGYLYNCSNAAAARVAPYRVLDRDAQTKDYYVVWAPAWVGVTPEAFADLGTAVRLSDTEILVGLEAGFGPGELRAVEHRIELIKLEPVTPVDWKADAEAPPTKKDPRIEGAIKSITAEEYAGYIRRLQDFRTRCTDTTGCDAARDYIRNFFASQNLDATRFEFECMYLSDAQYAAAPGAIVLTTSFATLRLTADGGSSWRTVSAEGTAYVKASYWFDARRGLLVGYNNKIGKTADGGWTWEYFTFEPRHKFCYPEILYFVTDKTGWMAGGRKISAAAAAETEPFLKKTSDGGRTWTDQALPSGFSATTVDFYDERHGWLGGYDFVSREPAVLYTDDGGATWRRGTLFSKQLSVRDIAAAGPREAWGAYGTAYLLHTTDGLNWTYSETGVFGVYNHVEFPDSGHGYAGGDKMIKTTDGGGSWREVKAAPPLTCDFMSFADANHGLFCERYGEHLYRTTDGGATFEDAVGAMDRTAENVVGERRGSEAPDEVVIIGGHFDSASDHLPSWAPGAEDNASGTACAMAAARAFKNASFKRTVRYLAFGAEESGLVGSRAYADYCARKGEKVVAVLNADMVCYDEEGGARDDYAVSYQVYGHSFLWLLEYLRRVGDLYGGRLIYDEGGAPGDHQNFQELGFPAIGVEGGAVGPGGGVAYPWYHTTQDTLDKLQPELGVRFVRDYAAMLAHLAGVGDYLFEPTPAGTASVPFARPFAVYPNPFCYGTSTGGVNFVGLKAPARVEIYDLAGRRVAREEVAAGCDECVWRPARVGGEALSPGVYLYRVEGQGQREAGKVVVAR